MGGSGYDMPQPHTPLGNTAVKSELPYDDTAIVPGHGDKRKREAHELADAIKEHDER